MAIDLTVLETSLHSNLESELEADRQKDEFKHHHEIHKANKSRSFLGKLTDGLKSAVTKTFTKENLAWAGMVFAASVAASFGAMGVGSLIGETGLKSIAEFASQNLPFSEGMDSKTAGNTIKMLSVAALLPITFGFARSFRDGFEKGENSKHHPKHREHERGHAKVREHAQGHSADQQRDHERVAGTVAPIPVLTTAMKTEPAAPMHANSNAAERPAYLQNILAQGPRSQERSHVAALEEQQQVAASSRSV